MTKKFAITSGIIAGALLAVFITVSLVLCVNGMAPLGIDTAVANWVYSVRGEEGGATFWFFRIVTELGYTYFIVALVVLMFIIWKAKLKAWFFGGTILVSWGVQKILKLIFARPRPDEAMWWMSESSTSFPSGHSMMVATVFVLLVYFILTSPTAKLWLKYLITILSSIAVILVPISRIILGVHYFTDVLAGLFIGAFMALIGIVAYHITQDLLEKKKSKSTPPPPTTPEPQEDLPPHHNS